MSRPAQAVINISALRNNYLLTKSLSSGKVLAVVKADAYGHGAVKCAQALTDIADAFAVTCIEEALELRETGICQPIILLEGFFDGSEISLIEKHDLDLVIHCEEQLKIIESSKFKKKLRFWLKMDTGINRIGFPPSEYKNIWQRLNTLSQVDSIIMMSHLGCADEPDSYKTMQQLKVFKYNTIGLSGEKSIANSAGIIAYPEARAEWNRPGLMLYGISPFPSYHSIEDKLQASMELQSSIISIKNIPAGSPVGYGGSWVAKQDTRLGVIAIGYADGYPRHAENTTPVLINNHRVPLVGRVSMDMITVDLSNLLDIQVGDKVVLWGEGLPVSEIATRANTVAYQLLCNLNRVRIKYEY